MKGKIMTTAKKNNKLTKKAIKEPVIENPEGITTENEVIEPIVKKVEKEITAEAKILGAQPEIITKKIYNYENPKVKYKITNLQVKNTPIFVTGDVVETFIGNRNKNARYALKEGAKKVITKDLNGDEIYKIEVV